MKHHCSICNTLVDSSVFYHFVKRNEEGAVVEEFGICPYCMESIRVDLKKITKREKCNAYYENKNHFKECSLWQTI